MINNKDMNMNDSENWVEVSNNVRVSKFHPCQYCGKRCIGSQCKECHLKMVSERNSDCIECGKSFYALRKDGTKRQRCFECQKLFNEIFYKNCPGCSKTFRFLLDNGKEFSKCGECYTSDRIKREEKNRKEEEKNMYDCKKCKNEKTNYSLCGKCFREEKEMTDVYMLSKCFTCGQRFKGSFKFCSKECRK